MKKCKACGSKYTDDRAQCPNCGSTDYLTICENCGEAFDSGFCPNCGVQKGSTGKICPVCGKKYFSAACPDCGYIPNKQETIAIKKEKTTNKVTVGKILLWIFFLPIMATIAVWKKQEWKLILKIGLTLLIWGAIILIAAAKKDNTSNISSNSNNSTSSEQTQQTSENKNSNHTDQDENKTISIVESGWTYSNGYIFYSVKIKNNSSSYTIEYPMYRVTGYDEQGNVIHTFEHALKEIKAGRTVSYGTQALSCETKPASVECTIIEPDDYKWISDENSDYPGLKELTTQNITVSKGELSGKNYSGVIINENDTSIKRVAVSILFRDSDGKLLGGQTSYVDGVSANGKTPFSIQTYSNIDTDNYEIYAQPW